MASVKEIIIEKQNVGLRLDNAVLNFCQDLTRSRIKNLIDENKILVNQSIQKAGYKVKLDDKIEVSIDEPVLYDVLPQDIKLDIVYEDDDLAVINKPQGMVVHPAGGSYSGTLVNALLFNIKNLSGINGQVRPGIVHRLDKDTSGLIVIAKNDNAHVSLSNQIAEKSCKRYYKALLYGKLSKAEGEIKTYLNRGTTERKKIFVVPEGKGRLAITKYKIINQFDAYAFVEFELFTGRTHQIRVHASHIGHPIVGDRVYCKIKDKFNLNGQLLHAYKLEFKHPVTKGYLSFESNLPDYFEKTIKMLSK